MSTYQEQKLLGSQKMPQERMRDIYQAARQRKYVESAKESIDSLIVHTGDNTGSPDTAKLVANIKFKS